MLRQSSGWTGRERAVIVVGAGATPSEIRNAILGAEGEWGIALRRPDGVAIAAIKAIRGVYGLGLKEAKDVWDSRAPIRDTRGKCEELSRKLMAEGVKHTVGPE